MGGSLLLHLFRPGSWIDVSVKESEPARWQGMWHFDSTLCVQPTNGGFKKKRKKEYNDGVFFTAVLWDLSGSKDLERGYLF